MSQPSIPYSDDLTINLLLSEIQYLRLELTKERAATVLIQEKLIEAIKHEERYYARCTS